MLSTKNGMQEQCISPKTRCPYQRHCSLPLCSHCSPCQKTTDMSCKSQRISAQPILMQTNRDIQTTTYFSLNSAMRSRPFARIKEAEETPTLGLPIRFFAPNVLQIVYGHKIYKEIKLSHLHNLPSAN